MGGIPVTLCGDFRQILPVIRSGARANIINACIKKAYLWIEIVEIAGAFAKMLINYVDGKADTVQLPGMVSVAELGNSAT